MRDNDLHARLYEAIDTNPLDVIGIVETALAERAGELAQARAGEDDTPVEEGTEITPGQWIYRWNRLSAEQRLTKIEGLFHMLDVGYRCLMHGHDDLRLELDAANLRIRELMFGSLAEQRGAQVLAVRQLAEQWASLSGAELDVDAAASDPKRLAAWHLSECGRAVLALLVQPGDQPDGTTWVRVPRAWLQVEDGRTYLTQGGDSFGPLPTGPACDQPKES